MHHFLCFFMFSFLFAISHLNMRRRHRHSLVGLLCMSTLYDHMHEDSTVMYFHHRFPFPFRFSFLHTHVLLHICPSISVCPCSTSQVPLSRVARVAYPSKKTTPRDNACILCFYFETKRGARLRLVACVREEKKYGIQHVCQRTLASERSVLRGCRETCIGEEGCQALTREE